MFLFQQRLFLCLCVATVFALSGLSGCGGGSSSASSAAKAVTRTQQFYGVSVSNASYTVDSPIDQSNPVVVTVGGATLTQGTDYFVDKTFPTVVHLNNPVPATTFVVITYMPQPATATNGSGS